ncbi:hypothetical protein ACFPER_05555 [Agromyces aurantiacus]|uniref:Iron-containing redox enzyme family protein n=1 Tax=Agromyces aurantiacus TaxID=165814 RepID=A0ABV9R2M5_9MICO|nr:hypothetical protein [Agromyces aurantiacus]MBM7502924.1 hypothetical protein [Agromyces aurantiacus]
MSEHDPRPAHEPERPLALPEQSENQEPPLEERVEAGLSAAAEAHREIDLDTARHIAEALARAEGEDSALARFANTGVGGYLALREEYLDLYNDPDTPTEVKRWIDWFGTFLVWREGIGSERRFMAEQLDPVLDRLLVRTDLPVNGGDQRAHVPANLSAREIIGLGARVQALDEYQEFAFRAFLTLPDVNAADPNLVESYRESHVGSFNYIEDALRELAELDGLEDELRHLTDIRGLPQAAIAIDYQVIEDHVREAYDIVSEGWQIHVFNT